MLKRITAIAAVVALGFMAGTASAASFTETFDGAGYTPGDDVPSPPWAECCSNQELFEVTSNGFNGTQGAVHLTTGTWGEGAVATGVTGAGDGFTYSWMLYHDSSDVGLTRLGSGLDGDPANAGPTFNTELDNNQMFLGFSDSGPNNANSLTLDGNTWYEFLVTGTPAAGGWNVKAEHRACSSTECTGAYDTDIAEQLWSQPSFVPAYTTLSMIGLSGNSAMDNIAVQDIPEPSALALLGLGGVMLLVRRRR